MVLCRSYERISLTSFPSCQQLKVVFQLDLWSSLTSLLNSQATRVKCPPPSAPRSSQVVTSPNRAIDSQFCASNGLVIMPIKATTPSVRVLYQHSIQGQASTQTEPSVDFTPFVDLVSTLIQSTQNSFVKCKIFLKPNLSKNVEACCRTTNILAIFFKQLTILLLFSPNNQ